MCVLESETSLFLVSVTLEYFLVVTQVTSIGNCFDKVSVMNLNIGCVVQALIKLYPETEPLHFLGCFVKAVISMHWVDCTALSESCQNQ